MARAVEPDCETPPVEDSLDSITPAESETDECHERMLRLLEQGEPPTIHLWGLFAEING